MKLLTPAYFMPKEIKVTCFFDREKKITYMHIKNNAL